MPCSRFFYVTNVSLRAIRENKFLAKISRFTDYHLTFLNSFLAGGNFCHLLKTFANNLDPDQDRQIVGPDPDPISLTL